MSRSRRRSYVELLQEEDLDVRLERRRSTRQHGLGLTVAGGGGSFPYRGQDEGIFVAQIVPNGAADAAGMRVDDEILTINGIPCADLDHHQAVNLLRNSGGDLRVRIRRQVPRRVESAIPSSAPLSRRSRSSHNVSSSSSSKRREENNIRPFYPSTNPPHQRRMRSNSQHNDLYPSVEEDQSGYLRPRTPPSARRRSSSSYNMSDNGNMLMSPYSSSLSAALQHTHLDSTGVHFHPYCFACNPSVVHLNLPLGAYHHQLPSASFPTQQHLPRTKSPAPSTYSSGYPSPIQLHTYGTRNNSKIWQPDTDDDDEDDQEEEDFRKRITVGLRRDEINGLGFIVSSRDDHQRGVYVSGIVKGGVADRSAQLVIGDRILSINGLDVEEARHRDVVGLLSRSKPFVQLEVERDPSTELPEVFESDEPNASTISYTSASRRNSSRLESDSTISARRSYYEQPDDSVELRSKQPMRSSMRSSVTRSPSPPATPPEFDNGHRYQHPMRSSLRSSHQSRPRTPSPPPPPPPPPVAPIKRLNDDSSDSRLSELQFPPPPTELGRFRETITKQTLTETIVTRLTNNQRGKLPVITEDVIIHKDIGTRLGLRIAGGKDSSCIPFGLDEPGIFISRVVPHGPAARTERLRIGDRILKIGSKDVTDWTHAEVIRALSEPRAQQIILYVRHDPPPEGLDEFLVHRNENEQYGVKIVGGVREHASYSNRIYDSGIFVSKVIRGGAIARDGRLKVGMRLLEVNGANMIGVTRREAIDAFRRAGHVLRLLVCDGWTSSSTATNGSVSLSPEETSSVMSNGSSIDDRPPSSIQSIPYRPRSNTVAEPRPAETALRNGVDYNDESKPLTPSPSKKILGIKVSDLVGSRHFPKTPPENSADLKTTTIVMSKTSTHRPDREVFDHQN